MDIDTLVAEFRTELPWHLGCSDTVATTSAYAVRLFLRNQSEPFPQCVTYQHIVSWLDHLSATPPRNRAKAKREASTVNGHLKALKRFTRWALAREFIESDPIANLRGRAEQDRIILAPSVQTVAKILVAAENHGSTPESIARNYALICMLVDSGPRVNELVQMNLEDVLGDDGELLDHCVIHGKGSKDRLMALQPLVKEALARYLPLRRVWPGEHALWVTRDGARMDYSAFRGTLKRICKKAGVKVSLHDFRRFALSEMRRSGIDQINGMTLSGHSDADVYVRYLRGVLAEQALEQHAVHSPLKRVLGETSGEPAVNR